MKTGKLTPRANDTVSRIRFSGSFGQPDGFGSVLEADQRESGEVALTLFYKMNNSDHMWSVMLTNEQRKALGKFLFEYEPTLFERF